MKMLFLLPFYNLEAEVLGFTDTHSIDIFYTAIIECPDCCSQSRLLQKADQETVEKMALR